MRESTTNIVAYAHLSHDTVLDDEACAQGPYLLRAAQYRREEKIPRHRAEEHTRIVRAARLDSSPV